MAELKNTRHEKFAQLYAQGIAGAVAYQQAGFSCKTNDVASAAATRLLKDVKVATRIDELKAEAAKNAEVTLEWLIAQGQEIMADAKLAGQNSAAVAALKELGVLTGHREEKRQTTVKTHEDRLDYLKQSLSDVPL